MIAAPVSIRTYYARTPRYFLVRDGDGKPSDRLLFHVEHGDYFPTLATILGLIADQLQTSITNGELPTAYQISTLETMREDLLYLWKHFRIEPK